MKKLTIICIVLFFTSCKKEKLTDTNCWDCDMQNNGQYTDAGCYTNEVWYKFELTYVNGDIIDKTKYCHKR